MRPPPASGPWGAHDPLIMDEYPTLKLYHELAEWWPLLSCPADYAEEAGVYGQVLLEANPAIHNLLELGSGGGNNASHLKKTFQLTLTDRSADMIAVSQRLNPDLPHLQGDMRSLRLGRTFDAVFIHDSIMYMTTRADLLQAMQTAAAHLSPGGVALLVPDMVRETFRPGVEHGGHDGGDLTREYGDTFLGRSLRYLMWTYDPDPDDEQITNDFAYLLRRDPDQVSHLPDRHINGLFSRAVWLELMEQAGFAARLLPLELSDLDPGMTEMVLGVRRGTQ